METLDGLKKGDSHDWNGTYLPETVKRVCRNTKTSNFIFFKEK